MPTAYRIASIPADGHAPGPALPALIAEPFEALVDTDKADWETHRRMPDWWIRHHQNVIGSCIHTQKDKPRLWPFMLSTIWTFGVPALWMLAGQMGSEGKSGMRVFVGLLAVAAVILANTAKKDDLRDEDLAPGWTLLHVIFTPISLYLTFKEVIAWCLWRLDGCQWKDEAWSESRARDELFDRFRRGPMAAHFHRMTELRARIDACERESAAADERAKLFRRNAAQALKSKEEAVSKQLTSSVAVEERRMETLRAQIKHAGAAYEEAQARCKALEGFLTQYGTLQTSRETLRETGSLDPHDTSDADLRALMKEEHLAILAALESAEEPFRPRQAAQANDADDLAERIEAAAARKAR